MRLILNIGLAVDATPSIAAHVALEIVKANGFITHKHKVVQSDTEPTLVVEVTHLSGTTTLAGPAVRQTASDLQQDCIAAWSVEHQRGLLIGPKAAAWGPFNPDLFIMLDGRRLSAHLATQAA